MQSLITEITERPRIFPLKFLAGTACYKNIDQIDLKGVPKDIKDLIVIEVAYNDNDILKMYRSITNYMDKDFMCGLVAVTVPGNGHGEKIYKERLCEGNLIVEKHMRSGSRHGPHRTWTSNGKLVYDYMFDDGKEIGLCREWYPNGNPRIEKLYGGMWRNELQYIKKWDENGKVTYEKDWRPTARVIDITVPVIQHMAPVNPPVIQHMAPVNPPVIQHMAPVNPPAPIPVIQHVAPVNLPAPVPTDATALMSTIVSQTENQAKSCIIS